MGSNVLGGAATGASAGAAFGPWGAVIGGVAGGAIGALSGDGEDGDASDAQIAAAQNAASLYNQYAQQAINQLNTGYDNARNDINLYYNRATEQGAPYNFAGLNAFDLLQQGIGMGTLPGGSFELQQAFENQRILDAYNNAKNGLPDDLNQLKNIVGQYQAARWNPAFAGVAGNIGTPQSWDQEISKRNGDIAGYINGVINDMNTGIANISRGADANYANSFAQYKDQLQKALDKYQANQALVNKGAPNMTAAQQDLVKRYNEGTLAQSLTYDKNKALQTFFNTPEYQLLFNQGGSTTDPNATVLDRFRADPGYQFALDQGVKARDASAAARGMLLSGNQLTALTDYGQGMADQQFNSYRDRLANTYGNYLQRLGVVSGYGTQFAANNQNILTGQGNNLANLSTGLSQNIANVLTGQGEVNANSLLSAGNARASGYATAAAANNQGMGNMLGNLSSMIGNLNQYNTNQSRTSSFTGAGSLNANPSTFTGSSGGAPSSFLSTIFSH
jgi:hypothetical protein